MKAFVVGRYGSKDGLQKREVPEPEVGEHDVLVQARVASINPLDAKIAGGARQAPRRARGDDGEHGQHRVGQEPRR